MDGGEQDAPAAREGLARQLAALEDYVARADVDGEPLPPHAREMAARLREIIQALDGLTASLDDGAGARAPDLPRDSAPP